MRRFLFVAVLCLGQSVAAQDAPPPGLSAALSDARESWLRQRYDGIWEVIRPEAEAGNPVAQNLLGLGLTAKDAGQGLAYDPQAGFAWLSRASDQGFLRATYNLALFWSEEHAGFGPDYVKTRALAQQAFEQGYIHAPNLIGDLHYNGHGTPQDYAAALAEYRKAADLGSYAGLRKVGYAYFHGEGVAQDVGLSKLYLERAVAAGDRTGIRDLAWLLEGNEGIGRDLTKAYLLYRLGVEKGDARAAYELAGFVAYDGYAGFWHDPVKGYGYCLLAQDWGHQPDEGTIQEACEALAEGLDADQRGSARQFADGLK